VLKTAAQRPQKNKFTIQALGFGLDLFDPGAEKPE
jgi:hypothetical protein